MLVIFNNSIICINFIGELHQVLLGLTLFIQIKNPIEILHKPAKYKSSVPNSTMPDWIDAYRALGPQNKIQGFPAVVIKVRSSAFLGIPCVGMQLRLQWSDEIRPWIFIPYFWLAVIYWGKSYWAIWTRNNFLMPVIWYFFWFGFLFVKPFYCRNIQNSLRKGDDIASQK